MEEDFFRIYVQTRAKKQWEARRGNRPRLFFDPVVKREFDGEGISGEMGLTLREPDSFCRVRFFKEHGVLAKKAIDLGGLFFDATVNNDSLIPAYTYEDVEKDQAFVDTILEMLRQAPALYLDMARVFRDDKEGNQNRQKQARTHLLSWVNYVLGPRPEEPLKEGEPGAKAIKTHPADKKGWTRSLRIYDETLAGKGPVETLELTGDDPVLTDLWKDLPLFRTISGRMASLNELQKDLDKYSMVAFVREASPGPRLDGKTVVVADGCEEEILRKYFGWYKVINYEKGLSEERNALQHMNRPARGTGPGSGNDPENPRG